MDTLYSDKNYMQIAKITFSYPNDGRKLKKLVQMLVQWWFVACIQVINYMHSYYMREGKLTKEQEKLVVCKTSLDKKDKLIEIIKKNHPYETPEILIEIVECNEEYEKRVGEQKGGKK